MDSGGLFRAVVDGALRRVSGHAGARRGSTALATALLAALAAGEAAGQPGGLFRGVAPTAAAVAPGLPTAPDPITLRRRLVAIDFGQLAPAADTAATSPAGVAAAPSGVLTLNLFDDASFTGLVRSVAPTFSGGYSLSGPVAGVEMGTMTLVVNGEVVAGSVRTPEATYRIRPAGAGLHAVSEVDLSRLPPLGEPIPGRGWEEEERPPPGPDSGFPAPVEPRLAPPVPTVFRAIEDASRAEAQGSIATDRAALEALYDATDGPNWTDSTNWKTDAPLGEWFGVRTDTDGRVMQVLLTDNGLAGSIPDTLGTLSRLQLLGLEDNALTGPIAVELVTLENLVWLALRGNELTGAIPAELGRLTNLTHLYLSRNDLTGAIPAELGRLDELLYLLLDGNELTGAIPAELGRLTNLWYLGLSYNDLTGAIPADLGSTNLATLLLDGNDLTGPIPPELGNLTNLGSLVLQYNWGLTGPLPEGLRSSPLENLNIFSTQTCAPTGWRDWLGTMGVYNVGRFSGFSGRLCGAGTDVIVDVAVVYTQSARDAAGGVAAIEAEIDLMVAATSQAYEASGVHHRLALVERSEVPYTETGNSSLDLRRLADPSDGHMDEVHEMRDRVGADLAHLVVGDSNVGGLAYLPGAFSLGRRCCFAHELGHNMGLGHDRYTVQVLIDQTGGSLRPHPLYGYVNQRAFEAGAAPSSCWGTIMAYATQCADAGLPFRGVARFSNPRQAYEGAPLGVPYTGNGESGLTGPADASAVLNATGPAMALLRDRPAGLNLPPTAVGTLPDRRLSDVGSTLDLDVSQTFADPDGDALTYAVSSSAPRVVTVLAAGARVTLTAVAEGTATIRVTATDPGGLSATQSFTATVTGPSNRPPEAVGVLGALTIGLDDGAVTLDVSGAFRDADGDALTYGATSSAPAVAAVTATGSAVTVTPVSEGTATVTVTATDGGGSNTAATQTFTVTVGAANRPPEAVGVLGPLTIGLDEGAVTVEVSGAFRDPDGDALTYGATSSAPAVAAVTATGSAVTVTPVSEGTATVTVTATDGGGSNTAATQAFTVTVGAANRPPEAVGVLGPLTIGLDEGAVTVDVSSAFRDPDGDALTYGATSSAPAVAAVTATGSAVTVTPVSEGTATVTVTATDGGGSDTAATQAFRVTVPRPFTDPVITPGVTPVRAVHFTELRTRIDGVRASVGLGPYAWTDPVLTAGSTRVRLVHLLEMRWALAPVFAAKGQRPPFWTDAAPTAGSTPIRAAHLMELRAAVLALE